MTCNRALKNAIGQWLPFRSCRLKSNDYACEYTMSKWLSILALTVSVLAIGISIRTYQEADARATDAVARREQELVRRYAPNVERICEEFGVVLPSDPATIEELMAPLLRLVTGLDNSRNAEQIGERDPD